ncbi:MAG: tetratricopeptide repeat protein [Nitrospinae bacterium]|nr:tetratricopeptide repeat protein [Nitrospinota bacterium]
MTFNVGDVIGGRYQIHRIFGGAGRSGMGVVLACYDRKSGSPLALKTYQQGFYHDKVLVDSFKRGALAWIHLDRHPAIVQAHGVFNIGERLFLGLELIATDEHDRNNLSHYLRDPIPLRQALLWAIHFCDGMEYARTKGITPHRDIKPDNLMVTKNRQMKVSDFDLAGLGPLSAPPKGNADTSGSATPGLSFINIGHGKFVAGTPPWMAPEQFEGEADTVSDIYSFGVVLYQMANNGGLPIRPTSDGDWGKAHASRIPIPLKGKLWPIIAQCLAKSRVERFGGTNSTSAFTELREAVARLWEKAVPGEAIPEMPKGATMEASDYSDKGVSLTELGLIDQAMQAFKKAIELDPKYPPVYLNAGVALTRKGNKTEAVKAYKKALSLDPTIAEGYNNYGLLMKDAGDLKQAEAAFRKAIHLKPDLTGAYENLGILLSESGRKDEAISIIAKAVEHDPSNPGHRYTYGVTLERMGRIEEALAQYQEAVRIAPNNGFYHNGLGTAYRMLGDMERAVECWQEAARLDPRNAICRFSLGITYERAGYIDHAYRYYKESTQADPTFPDTYYNLGLMLANATLFDEAADCFENFVRYITPQLAPHKDKAAEYVADFRKRAEVVRKQEEDYVEAVYNHAHHLLNLGRYPESKVWLDRAMERKPDYAPAIVGYGLYYERVNNLQSAADCYRKAIQTDPGYAIALNNLGWVNYHMGNYPVALEALQEYVRRAPPDQEKWVEDAKNLMEEIRRTKG